MPKSILIADDQAEVRRILRLALERAGFSICAEAEDGFDAVEKASRFTPDLMIVDLLMPKMSGVEAASALRNRFPTVPIILFTMYGVPALAAAAGVTMAVEKSEGVGRLIQCVQRLVEPSGVKPANLTA